MASCSILDFTDLGVWPDDCFDQQIFIQTMQDKLNELREYVEANLSSVVILSQATEPTQGQWEAAYTVQTGFALPIPASATLLWYDTTNSQLGGQYGTITGSATVESRTAEYVPGTILVSDVEYDATARSSSASLMGNGAFLPEITFTTDVICTLFIDFNFVMTTTNVASGVDFMLDGVKLGSQYQAVPPNGGLVENLPITNLQSVSYVLEDMPAGIHTVKPLLGVAGAPGTAPTLAWGGANNVTSFAIRAMVQ
jgi:hypothetical protein